MNNSISHKFTQDFNPQPHTWEKAAEAMRKTQLGGQLRRWFCCSNLPGVVTIDDQELWSLNDRIVFLKLICGERK